MNREEFAARKAEIEAQYGPWTAHNIMVGPDMFTMDPSIPSLQLRSKRFLQLTADILRKPFNELRVLDLACCEGMYALEFAAQGAQALGIEGRESHLVKARFTAEALGLSTVKFEQGDVRAVSRATHGTFDVVLCAGILYHLSLTEQIDFLKNLYEMCDGIVIIDSEISFEQVDSLSIQGETYWGKLFKEHDDNASEEEKIDNAWASLDTNVSFHPTLASLNNMLLRTGFTSLLQAHVPTTYDQDGRITVVAMKGNRIQVKLAPEKISSEVQVWPELDEWRRANEERHRGLEQAREKAKQSGKGYFARIMREINPFR